MVDQAFSFHPIANAHLRQQINGSLLQYARAHTLLRILTAAVFDYNRINPLQIQKMRQHETGRPRTNNSDLGSQ